MAAWREAGSRMEGMGQEGTVISYHGKQAGYGERALRTRGMQAVLAHVQ